MCELLWLLLHSFCSSLHLLYLSFNIIAEVTADIQTNLVIEVEEVFVYSVHSYLKVYLCLTSIWVRFSNQTESWDVGQHRMMSNFGTLLMKQLFFCKLLGSLILCKKWLRLNFS